ncbi:MAG: alpha/beta hydrolase [Propionibacteriaceae bacterium]|jgi:pimeloyl-ACP methyl ester carboxylesterase|nr:alpha/beta hydrolase [Propionibacteriaceae bacterium]
MTELASYLVPGFFVSDHVIPVPLDWADESWGRIDLFYRVVVDPAKRNEDLPLLVFLQGGPGGAGPRPNQGPAWLKEAVKHYRVILPDQRGTGRSSLVDGEDIARYDDPAEAAWYLRKFLADSIVQDLEHLRHSMFGGQRWTALGQSYGGFLTLTYLSHAPGALNAALIAGGVPGVPASAADVYRHTFPRAERRSREFYRRFPKDLDTVALVADRLAEGDVTLPNGDALTIPRFQSIGLDLGMKPGYERLHWLIDTAFARPGRLSDAFLYDVMNRTATAENPLYWTLQEFVYGSGANGPIDWAAAHELERHPEFEPGARPLLFFGEMAFPWMFHDVYELRPFKQAVELMMRQVEWPLLYDPARLAANEVPVEAAVYFDDLYVDSGLQLETLQGLGNSHAWVTNEYEHDGLRTGDVFARLHSLLQDRGGPLA